MSLCPQQAIDLVKKYEGCRLTAYQCPAKVWTVGWGSTGPGIKDGTVWTQQQADDDLQTRCDKLWIDVRKLTLPTLNSNRISALISFAYNLGFEALVKSTLCKLVQQSKMKEAAQEFDKWVHAGGKTLPGLVARRAAERQLFEREE